MLGGVASRKYISSLPELTDEEERKKENNDS